MASECTTYFYDALTGEALTPIPTATLRFSSGLDQAKQLSGTINPTDPNVAALDVWGATRPARTVVAVDYNGTLVWGGIVLAPRAFTLSQKEVFPLQANELWAYFTRRVQATDYSSPPYSGINPPPGTMPIWDATNTGTSGVYDPVLIAWQVIYDAMYYTNSENAANPITYGSLLGGIPILANGQSTAAAYLASPGATPTSNYINITYPYSSLQTVDSIVSQIATLGVDVGFDYGIDIAYSAGPGSQPVAVLNLSAPVRGRPFSQTNLVVDTGNCYDYTVTESGDEAAWQLYERGGSGAIDVSINVNPQEQGYPLLESVIDRSFIVSGNITAILSEVGYSDLYVYSYPPVTFSVVLDPSDPACQLGNFQNGDNVWLRVEPDERFPNGLQSEWRITSWAMDVPDAGAPKMTLTLSQPPFLPTGPAV